MKSARSKACDISQKVREEVFERDDGSCVICGYLGIPNAHYIPRSAGGLGIKENVVTMCETCHHEYDNGYHKDLNLREVYAKKIKAYLDKFYPGFTDDERKFKNWKQG